MIIADIAPTAPMMATTISISTRVNPLASLTGDEVCLISVVGVP